MRQGCGDGEEGAPGRRGLGMGGGARGSAARTLTARCEPQQQHETRQPCHHLAPPPPPRVVT